MLYISLNSLLNADGINVPLCAWRDICHVSFGANYKLCYLPVQPKCIRKLNISPSLSCVKTIKSHVILRLENKRYVGLFKHFLFIFFFTCILQIQPRPALTAVICSSMFPRGSDLPTAADFYLIYQQQKRSSLPSPPPPSSLPSPSPGLSSSPGLSPSPSFSQASASSGEGSAFQR